MAPVVERALRGNRTALRRRLTRMTHSLVAALLAVGTMLVTGCGDDAASGDRPRVVEDPPRMDLDGDPPYGPGVEAGEAYDYVLYTHCGIEWAPIDGVWWHTDRVDDGNANPPEGWGTPFDAGTLAVEADDRATYTSDTGIEVEFRRTEITEAPFTCV